jgi:hypothetical protein
MRYNICEQCPHYDEDIRICLMCLFEEKKKENMKNIKEKENE